MGYFNQKEVSNSDLSWLKNQLYPTVGIDSTNAYRMGNLIDGMLTENESGLDYYKRTCFGEKYTKQEFSLAEKMKNSFLRDEFCRLILSTTQPQVIRTAYLNLQFNKINFNIHARCKWDLRGDMFGADIKSTDAKTQKDFESAYKFFSYHRQRAWYMDIDGFKEDVVIGISKKNFKIFKIFINTDSELYKQGKDEYLHLAYKWNLLFGETKI